MIEERVHRDVVSYVRRSARMNPSQQHSWDLYHDRFAVEVPSDERSTSVSSGAKVDWPAVFGRTAPLIVEIGAGAGDTFAPMAAARPDADLVAFEVFEPAAASLLGRLGRDEISNARLVTADGAQGLEHLFAPGSLTEIWVFFADPWHKKRHHKRRLVSPGFARLAASRLVPGGALRLATDWDDYAEWMREVLDAEPGLMSEHPGGWAPRPGDRPVSKYEQKGLDAGRTIRDLVYRRLA